MIVDGTGSITKVTLTNLTRAGNYQCTVSNAVEYKLLVLSKVLLLLVIYTSSLIYQVSDVIIYSLIIIFSVSDTPTGFNATRLTLSRLNYGD